MVGCVYTIKNNSFDNLSKEEITSLFHAQDFNDLCAFFNSEITNNLHELISDELFLERYHLLIYKLSDLIKSEDEMYDLINLINNHIKELKKLRKEYTKHNKKKDSNYYSITRCLDNMNTNINNIYNLSLIRFENEYVSFFDFLIYEIKNIDAIADIFYKYPDFINTKNNEGESLFRILTRFYINVCDDLDEVNLTFYKRLIVLMLESNNLDLPDSEYLSIKEDIKYKLKSLEEDKKNILFLDNMLNKYFKNGIHLTQNDYVEMLPPIEIIMNDDERVDLRNLYTITIDKVNSIKSSNMVFDDAFSIEKTKDGYTLYVHIADLDSIIPRDKETDDFMKSLGETIYLKGNRTNLLSLPVLNLASLVRDNDKNALTFRFKIDHTGKVKDIDFMKSIIRVSDNLKHQDVFNMLNSEYSDNINKSNLKIMLELAYKLKRNRKDKTNKKSKTSLIINEFNELVDMETAKFFYNNNLIFPYMVYESRKESGLYIDDIIKYRNEHELSDNTLNMLRELVEIPKRITYSTEPGVYLHNNKHMTGNVGNPLREYISLETDRLIKDIIIDNTSNYDFWCDRIKEDCIEYTEVAYKAYKLKYEGK